MSADESIAALNIILPLLLLVITSFIIYLGIDNKDVITKKLKCNDCSNCPHRDSCGECGDVADENGNMNKTYTRNDIFRH